MFLTGYEIIASIAPRPVLLIAPEFDKDAHLQDIKTAVNEAEQVYKLFEKTENIQLQVPWDINRFSTEMRKTPLLRDFIVLSLIAVGMAIDEKRGVEHG